MIIVRSVDLCIEDNGLKHHTERYDSMQRNSHENAKLVVRRGESFRVRLTLNRPYSRSTDLISFVFTMENAEKPSHGHGTMIGTTLKINSYELGNALEWGSSIETISGDVLTVLIKPAATAPIGEWKVDVDSKLVNVDGIKSFKYPTNFYVLFNPWCPDDQVYMSGWYFLYSF